MLREESVRELKNRETEATGDNSGTVQNNGDVCKKCVIYNKQL